MDITNLPQETVEQNSAVIEAYLKERGIAANAGTVIGELVTRPGSLLFTATEEEFKNTLNNIDLNTAKDPYAAAILSNYGLHEQEAGVGTGYLLLLTESDEDLVIRQSTTFTAGGYTINIDRDYIGTVDYSTLSEAIYVPLRRYDDTRYYMLIEGSTLRSLNSPILPGTILEPSTAITGLSSAEIATAFVSTQESRTLDDLKEEVINGVSAKILAGPAHIKALLEESSELSVTDVSVVGMNDIEMLRDSKNIYGTSSGGYVDIYVKTMPYASVIEVTKTAHEVSAGRYKVLLTKDDAPGFYFVKSVSYGDNPKTSDIGLFSYSFGVDLTDEVFVPTFPETTDGRYSAYQNCAVEFDYSGVPSDDTAPSFVLEVVYIPGIKSTQAFVADPETRTPAADYVVKAAVPLFTSVELNVSYEPSGGIPDVEIIKEAVAAKVNSVPMGQSFLSGAEIACAVSSIYSDVVVKLPVVMESYMIDNVGAFHRKRSIDTLEIPSLPEQGITNKTATFMINNADISVRLVGDKK
jgi:hypothetical protein